MGCGGLIMGEWEIFRIFLCSCLRGATPYFIKTSLYPPFFFKFCPTNPPPPPTPLPCHLQPPLHCFIVLCLWLNGWSCHIWCAILLNNMNLHMSSLGTLVPQGPTLMCALYNNRTHSLRSDTCGSLLVLWFAITHTHKYTNTHSTLQGH